MGKRRPVVEPDAGRSRKQHQEATLAGGRSTHKVPASGRKALRRWYAENLQPHLSRMRPTEIALGHVYGARILQPRYFPSLAALVGVELPKEFAAALSSREGQA
jgi:hypothetical protein